MTKRQRCFTRHGALGWATFSPCERYRYILYRQDLSEVRSPASKAGSQSGVCIMLNPSTATEEQNDPTIRRTMSFLADAGCRDAYLLNLFAFRATQPSVMAAQADPVGPAWDRYFAKTLELARPNALVVCAWGSDAAIGRRGQEIIERVRAQGFAPHALRLNRDGNPAHPLYLPKRLRPTPIDQMPA